MILSQNKLFPFSTFKPIPFFLDVSVTTRHIFTIGYVHTFIGTTIHWEVSLLVHLSFYISYGKPKNILQNQVI